MPKNEKKELVHEQGNDKPRIEPKTKQAWWQPAITLFLRLSAWIAGPVLIAVFAGKWLDNKYESQPWFFLSCVGFAFIISMAVLIKTTIQEYKKIDSYLKKENPNNQK